MSDEIDRLAPLVDQLDSIVAELDDLMFDMLREASAEGATTRPHADKRLAQARRAVEKAAHLLRQS